MGRTIQRSIPSMSFGTLNEAIARHQYFEKCKHAHKQSVSCVVCSLTMISHI